MKTLLNKTERVFENRLFPVALIIYVFWTQIFLAALVSETLLWILVAGGTIALWALDKILSKKPLFAITHENMLWFAFIAFYAITFLYAPYKKDSMMTVIPVCLTCSLYFVFSKNFKLNVLVHKLIVISSLVHSFLIVVHFLFPDIINKINSVVLSAYHYERVMNDVKGGYITGITDMVASSALYVSWAIAYYFSVALVRGMKDYRSYIWIILFIPLALTQKRGMLLSVVLTGFIMILLNYQGYDKKKLFKLIAVFVLIVAALSAVAWFTIPQVKTMVEKFFRAGRALSGREGLWAQMWDWFKRFPLIGIGSGYAAATFKVPGHNVYLQMLAECGAIGLVVYLLGFGKAGFENSRRTRRLSRANTSPEHLILAYTAMFNIIYYFIFSLSGNPLYDYKYLVVFIMYFGLIKSVPSLGEEGVETERETSV